MFILIRVSISINLHNLVFSISLITVEYLIPLTVLVFAYSRIAYRLWGSKTPGVAQDERDHKLLQNKKKVR